MQKNDMVLKRKVLIDGENIPGLVSTGELTDKEGEIEVPSFGRKTQVKDGVKVFAPFDMKYKVARDTNTQKVFKDWFENNEYHDVTIVNCDATGAEVDRWMLRDCECSQYSEGAYDATSVGFFPLDVKISCTTTPIRTIA